MSGQHTRLSVWGLGLGMGITGAISMLFLGLVSSWFNWGTGLVTEIASLYIGFHSSLVGAIFGALWGFVDWFIGGLLIAAFYNLCSGCCGRCDDSAASSCDTKGHCH